MKDEQGKNTSSKFNAFGTARLLLPLIVILILIISMPITHSATAIAKVSNLTVDVGQYETINGIMIGDSATTYTYNFTVALANAVSPQIDPYSAVYDSQSTLGGFSNVIALANSKYLTQTQVFQANWNSINYGIFNMTQGSLTTTNINSIITEDNYNGIPTILTIGGSTQSIASVNAICASSNAQNAVVANIISAMKGSSTSGNTLPFNGILLDIEDNGAYWTGCGTQGNSLGTSNVLNMVKWINKLATNITAVNVNDTLGMYIDTGSGVNSSYNYKALSSNGVDYFDDADGIETNGAAYTLGKLSAVANVVGGKSKVNDEWCIEGIANGCDTISNTLSAIANVIQWGFGFSYFTNQFAAYGTNATQIFNAIASNVIRNTIITHNAIDTNALTSNTFTFQITSADSSNSLQKAKVTIKAGSNTLVSKYSSNFTINSQPFEDGWTVSNNPITIGAQQTLTANIVGGTSPYSYNILVYANNGLLVFNSLSPYISSLSNVVSYTQNSAWGTGTFTANVFISDSATTPVTVSNTLTYNVNTNLKSTSWTASNTVTDLNNYQTLNSVWSGGTSTFTANFLVYNNIGSLVANALYSGLSGTSNTFTFQMQPTWTTGTYTANIIITDSASATATNTLTFTVDTALNANPPTPTLASIDNGQSILLTSSPSGGTGSYTYVWHSGVSTSCASDLTPLGTASTQSVSPTSNTYYCYTVSDTALGVAISTSPANIIVNSQPFEDGWTASNNPITQGTAQTLIANIVGGTQPYSYNILVYNAIGSLVFNSLSPYTAQTGNIVIFTQSSAWGTGTFTANVYITDSANTPVTIYNSISYTVNTMVSATLSPLLSTIGIQNSQSYTGMISGGVGPYTANWVTYYGALEVGNLIQTSNSGNVNYTYFATSLGNFNTTLIVTDSLHQTESSKIASLIVINPSNPGGGSTGGGSTTTIPSNTPSNTITPTIPSTCNVTSGTATALLTNIGISEYNTYFGKSQYFGNSITVLGLVAIIFMTVITIATFAKKKLRWLAVFIDIALILPAIVAIGVQCVRV